MKIKYLIALLLTCSVFLTGCSGQSMEKPEQVLKVIEQAISTTEKATSEKDLKLARELWTRVSEYGVKAEEAGNKELADSLGRLASTYPHLVSYIESGNEFYLQTFRTSFDSAITQLKNSLSTQQGLKTAKR